MLLARLEQIDAAFIDGVCAGKYPESTTLDFKAELPGTSDKDKHELLKDVCAMSNTDGGDLVYGIAEANGAASHVTPLVAEPADAAARRLLSVVDANIEPRVQGLQAHPIQLPSGGYVMILRVQASFLGPHCVRSNSNRRFVARNGTMTSDFSFDQLRAAFDRTATLADRARQFIGGRLNDFSLPGRHTPKAVMGGPLGVFHLAPLASLAGRLAVDLHAIRKNTASLMHEHWGGSNVSFNLDGLVVYPAPDENGEHAGYTQVFRQGVLESVTISGGPFDAPNGRTMNIVWSNDLSTFFRQQTKVALTAAKDWGITGPAVLSFALLRVGGYELGVTATWYRRSAPASDRNDLIVPSHWIDEVQSADVDEVARPLLDTLWQGFGMERCLDFDEASGKFQPRRL